MIMEKQFVDHNNKVNELRYQERCESLRNDWANYNARREDEEKMRQYRLYGRI